MAYQDYEVRVTFQISGSGNPDYILPLVQSIGDPQEGIKATILEGTRGDGSIVIPGGKRSQEITIRGILQDSDGYKDIIALINEMRSEITTDVATLTLEHKEGITWVTDWSYTVRRIREIGFPASMRTVSQNYEVSFLVLAY